MPAKDIEWFQAGELRLKDGGVLKGEIEGATLDLVSRYGKLSVPSKDIAWFGAGRPPGAAVVPPSRPPPVPAQEPTQARLDDYFLLGAKGAQWTYSWTWEFRGQRRQGTDVVTNEGPATLDGQTMIKLSRSDIGRPSKGDTYFASSSDGVLLVGSDGNVQDRYNPPVLAFKAGSRPGASWESKGTLTRTIRESGKVERESYVAMGRVTGEERIRVAAGEFDAIKIVIERPGRFGGVMSTQWRAKGVGLLREESAQPGAWHRVEERYPAVPRVCCGSGRGDAAAPATDPAHTGAGYVESVQGYRSCREDSSAVTGATD